MNMVKTEKNENRSATITWMFANNMPEKMLHFFNIYLKKKSKIQDEIIFFDVGAAEGCFLFSVIKHFQNFEDHRKTVNKKRPTYKNCVN